MSPGQIILLAVALGMDAMSVAIALGHGISSFRQTFRLTWHFGLFQFLMPLIGVALGSGAAEIAGRYAPVAAFAMLSVIGARMILQAIKGKESNVERGGRDGDPTRGASLVWLSLATSMDALGAGFGLGLVSGSILLPALAIGVTAALMTYAGILLGRVVGRAMGRWAELGGGLILIGIGVNLLLR